MIKYQEILNKNLKKTFIDILKYIEKNGLEGENHLYITFVTSHSLVSIPNWLLKKYPNERLYICPRYWDRQHQILFSIAVLPLVVLAA